MVWNSTEPHENERHMKGRWQYEVALWPEQSKQKGYNGGPCAPDRDWDSDSDLGSD
jgi:hypothetical protein